MVKLMNAHDDAPQQKTQEMALTVFYDGGCPMCSREIGHYQKISAMAPILWIDITRQPDQLAAHDLSFEVAMARFHVLDAHGHWHQGISAFMQLWSLLPGYRWLSKVIGWMPGMEALMNWMYDRFSVWHFRRRCNQISCGVT